MAPVFFSHNESAYHAAVSMLFATGKACVIHPTGTGKSFLGFRLCEEHTDKSICWLSSSEYIFRTQLEKWVAAGGKLPQNIQFFTYAKLNFLSDEEIRAIRPDILIADEFHRMGAERWQLGVENLLAAYPNLPRLGLTATNIRYLDHRRDMALELFDGNAASEMSLGEAIARGVLNAPRYVLTSFQLEAGLKKYQRRLRRAKSAAVRDAGEKLLEALRRALEQADGLDVVFEKHMTDRAGKYLVFCSNFEHMREMISHVPEWFGRIDGAPHVYSAYSDDPETSRAFQAFKADESPDHLKLLFCIDMLNEGIHVENVSGVILFRPTVSPIVYKQQIGRALSASKTTEPVIIDVVNNIENLYSIGAVEQELHDALFELRSRGEGDAIVTERFRVIDELRNCRELFERLDETLSASWELMYRCAEAYFRQFGNLEVVFNYKTEEGYSLGAWVQTQRKIRAGTALGRLVAERIRRLDAIGMRWESAHDFRWSRVYRACVQYQRETGGLNVPFHYVTEDGIPLGRWMTHVRMLHKEEKYGDFYTREREKQLEELGMIWDLSGALWEQGYAEAETYYKEHGNLNVPKGYISNGVKLYAWLAEQRQIYRGNRAGRVLTEEQIRRLNRIQMQWDSHVQRGWAEGLAEAKQYVEEHGVFDAPAAYVSPSGYRLGAWLSRCRTKYHNGQLSGQQIEELEGLHIVWDKGRKNDWDRCFEYARDYYKVHGSLHMPRDYRVNGVWMNRWLNEQRQILLGKRKGQSMSPERLDKLRSIGFQMEDVHSQRWAQQYEAVKRYFDVHGNIRIPVNYRDDAGRRPYGWLANQRASYKAGRLAPERLRLLREIGFAGE